MSDLKRKLGTRLRPTFGAVVIGGLIAGCLHAPVKPPPPETALPAPAPAPVSEELIATREKNQALEQALATRETTIQELEQELAALKIQMLEHEAIATDIRLRSDNQQKRLDAAIIDVVRSKAKLRSLESKADAASTIAEAEIVLKALKKQAANHDTADWEEIETADQLLAMSSKEFNAQNFGGALYLANQTKGAVRTAQMRLSGEIKRLPLEGETSFVQPVPLKVLKTNSNLREGPGLDRKVTSRLDKNELLMGHSYKDRWIRVETQQGVTGWIFQTLVGAR